MKLALRIVNDYGTVSFYKKSGRLTFAPTSENPPKPRVYLDLRRVKGIWLLVPRGALLNAPPSAVLVDYETENGGYYRQFSVPVEEIEKEAKEGKLELRKLDSITVVTEWDADEPVTWHTIDLRTGEVKRGSIFEEDEEVVE